MFNDRQQYAITFQEPYPLMPLGPLLEPKARRSSNPWTCSIQRTSLPTPRTM